MSSLALPARFAEILEEDGVLLTPPPPLDGIHYFWENENNTIRLFQSEAGKFFKIYFTENKTLPKKEKLIK